MYLSDCEYDFLVRQAVKNEKYLTACKLIKAWKGLTIEAARSFYRALPEYKPTYPLKSIE